MNGPVFVDSSAWVALSVRRDALHDAATTCLRRLMADDLPLVTSAMVVAESYALIRCRAGHAAATTFVRSLRTSQRVQRLAANPDVELAAEQVLERYDDQDYSYVDAVSFVLMKRHRCRSAFAFDHHFRTMGYELEPPSG